MGPLLLARLLDLNDTQEGILTVAFEFADDEGLLLLDMDDLRTTLQYVGDRIGDVSLCDSREQEQTARHHCSDGRHDQNPV